MKTLRLSFCLLLLPAPMLAQARVPGPAAHALPTRVPVAVEAPSIDVLTMRRASGSTIGMISGGLIGAALGTYVGMGACSFNDDDQDKCIIRMPLHALAGAVVVGGLGWVVGRLISH